MSWSSGRGLTAVFVVLALFSFVSGALGSGKDGVGRIVYLTIDGKKYEIFVGKESSIAFGGKEHSVGIAFAPFCVFDNGDLSFSFPATMNCVRESPTPGLETWVLSGGDAAMTIQKYSVKMDGGVLLNGLKQQYVKMKASVDVKKVRFEGKNAKLEGTGLYIKLGNSRLSQDLYMVKKGNLLLVIILQDSLSDAGKHSKEYSDMLIKLKESLTIKK